MISTPLMVVLILGEMIYSHFHHRALYTRGDTFINLVCTSWNFVNDLIFRGAALAILVFAWKFRVFSFAEKDWVYWVLLFVGQDLMYYVLHYADHYSRFFWASHVTHHSSEKFNFTVAIRSSVFQPFYRFLFYLPLALVGFEALDIVFMYAACQVYGFWVHTELVGKLHPAFEFLFVTPSHHRVHHASNPLYLDKNMGMVLIIWDRLFGTFQEEREDVPVHYGLTSNIHTYHPLKVVFHEWKAMWSDVRRSGGWRNALGYIFGPPGWSHDGSRKTSRQLRSQWELEKSSDFETYQQEAV
ncbi:MAG: sterol desaturase family protein [Bacteroidetes bacterium]|nr:sterol desaturase family protein [Bacteroidota bacterium]